MISDHYTALSQVISDHYTALSQVISDHYTALSQVISDHYTALSQVISDHYTALSQVISDHYTALSDLTREAVGRVCNLLGGMPAGPSMDQEQRKCPSQRMCAKNDKGIPSSGRSVNRMEIERTLFENGWQHRHRGGGGGDDDGREQRMVWC